MGYKLLLFVFLSIQQVALAAPLAHFPDWSMEQAEEGWFSLTPPDGRAPILINAHSANQLEGGSVGPEMVYRLAQTGVVKKKEENVWSKTHGFYVQEEKNKRGEIGNAGITPDGKSDEGAMGAITIGGASTAPIGTSTNTNRGATGSSNTASPTTPTTPIASSTSSSAIPFSGNSAVATTGSSNLNTLPTGEAAKARVVIEQKKIQSVKGGKPSDPPPPPPPLSCENAKDRGALKEEQKELIFPALQNTCAFGENENLARANGRVTARAEQERSFDIPANAVICDLAISSSSSTMRYDDYYLFNYNGFLLSSNLTNALDRLDSESIQLDSGNAVNAKKYDWLKLRGASGGDGSYCIGSSSVATCQWPATEQRGNVSLEINPELSKALATKAIAGKQVFQYIIAGDDNDSDCQHSGLTLNAKLKYFLP